MKTPVRAAGGRLPAFQSPARLALRLAALALSASLYALPAAAYQPFVWDDDQDGIDDRVETVHLLGYSYSFENADTSMRQRIVVERLAADLFYGVYVVFDHDPTVADLAAVSGLGMPVLHRYEAVPALRSLATFPQAQAAAALPGVERVEAVPLLYPELRDGAASIAVRDPSEQVFPTWQGAGGAQGAGVVIAFLDTGVNDAAADAYPGHESLAGRCLGGAEFVHGDSLLDTPRDGSVNPVDRGGSGTAAHGTHVAGIALGSGGPSAYAVGVAPAARFVDVKVLTDAGAGTGVCEGLDWCIHNRARDWGTPGWQGIQVINLSLSSLDLTDGNDVASLLANRAVEMGMVVVASMGNEARPDYVPSPAGGTRVLAVGAMDDQRTGLPGDDVWAPFSNYGPRTSNGDGIASDEQKPDLLAPGMAVLSADGDLLSDGAQYQRLSGTSMAAAFVSGVAAALRSAYPSLTPAAMAELLHATARRDLAAIPPDVPGPDPRWRSSIGWGVADLHAAHLEMEQPGRSQVDRIELSSSPTAITAVLRTQRERGAGWFVFERAPDVAGAPGAFAPWDSVPAGGDSSLGDAVNRHAYSRSWTVPEGERGLAFWYRVSYTEGGARYDSQARRFVSPVGPPVATIELTIVHNAYDHDLTGTISVGTSPSALQPGGGAGEAAALSIPLPATGAAVASDWVTGLSTLGNVSWTFRVAVPEGEAETYLPPSSSDPWWLALDEGGYLNRSGRLVAYRVIWHAPGGDQVWEGGPVPMQTTEGGTRRATVPSGIVAVEGPPPARRFRFGPNPVAAGDWVTFELPALPGGALQVFNPAGRKVAQVPLVPAGAGAVARWQTRDAAGGPLPSGLYFVRAGSESIASIVVLRR